jgi:predicted MPP superfamily phosphohydrolase
MTKLSLNRIIIFLVISLLIAGGFYFFNLRERIAEKEKVITEISKSEKKIEEIKIGFITDIHGYTSSHANGNIRDKSRRGLENFIKHVNENYHPNFIIDGGDLIEGTRREGEKSFNDWKLLMSFFSKINLPIYHVIGNHERRGLTKNQWLELNNYKNTYYFFDYNDLRVIVLDGNEDDETEDNGIYDYQMTDKQLEWLEEKLSSAQNMRKIVFIHYPVILKLSSATNKPLAVDQASKLKELFAKYRVMAVFSGHVEILEMSELDGVSYFILPGQERSEDKTFRWLESFSEISVKEEVKIKLYYKTDASEEYRIINIPSDEYNKVEETYREKGNMK